MKVTYQSGQTRSTDLGNSGGLGLAGRRPDAGRQKETIRARIQSILAECRI
jgi:hypothetical protein